MSWNYRVMHRVIHNEHVFAIHECYYDAHGKIWACSAEPVAPQAEAYDSLLIDLNFMRKALKAPTLEYDSIPEVGAINPADNIIRP